MKHGVHGFSLVENLVALAVLAIGLLGSASLLSRGLATLRASTQRQAAVVLADDMAHRIGLSARQIDLQALPDLASWSRAVAARLPGGTGSITRAERGRVDIVTIDVRWAGSGGAMQRHRIDIAVPQ